MPHILALDISSTQIGWCYLHPTLTPLAKSIPLGGRTTDIAGRCLTAQQQLAILIAACGSIDCVAIEAPVAQYASAVIAQCRVAGAVLAEVRAHGLAWQEVSPAAAKRALTGKGNADKREMVMSAAERLGHDPLFLEFESRRSLWAAWMNDYCVYDEHAADALGIGLAAAGRVMVEASV